jgi:oxygen-independent coproporphyrinogen-3 oxidase
LLATGVSSFGHISGVHYQNHPDWDGYLGALDRGELPLSRGLRTTSRQQLIRELILQLKTGWLDCGYFDDKFGVDILAAWHESWHELQDARLAELDPPQVRLTRAGLLQVDGLLPRFFEPEHRGVRYT